MSNKIIVITGGADGIGYAVANSFLKKEAKTAILLDTDENQGNLAVKTLNSLYGYNKAVFYKCDVTKDLEKVWNKITTTYHIVDVLVNSAGVLDEKNPKRVMDINVTALVEFSLKLWETNRKDKSGNGGTIINLASIYGVRIGPYVPIYHASKFAVMGFTRSLGHKFNYERSGIRVIAVCPGFTTTKIIAGTIPTWDESIQADFADLVMSNYHQPVAAVGDGIFEIFESAQSGTAWVIENENPIEELLF